MSRVAPVCAAIGGGAVFALMLATAVGAASSPPATAPSAPHSPYAAEAPRAIKALSADEVDALLAGRGHGYARAAELNGYPGPAHVIELASPLALDDAQREATQRLFDAMQRDARTLGAELVAAERALDREFAARLVTPASLSTALQGIAALQARLREVHLRAHVAQLAVLSPVQVEQYTRLRGYHGAHTPG